MKEDELFCQLALSQVSGIGPFRFRKIVEQEESIAALFKSTARQLKRRLGLPMPLASAIHHFDRFGSLEKEWELMKKQGIRMVSILDPEYPQRLKTCNDAPGILFVRGACSFNTKKWISVIGTRNATEYGRRITEQLISELKGYDIGIVSGMAFGIDAIAHRSSIAHQIPTLGVIAHGHGTIYPPQHRTLAQEVCSHGALISEYLSHTKAEKGNFPMRNRIVAGIADATVIVETGIKGGSMITADIAFSYNRELFCIPGRIGDEKSAGCLDLIRKMKAQLIGSADDIAVAMGWKQKQIHLQPTLFPDMTDEEKKVAHFLTQTESSSIDTLALGTGFSHGQLASILLNMEMNGWIGIRPGKMIVWLGAASI